MAQFRSADLSVQELDDSIEFTINYKIEFQDFEKLIPWCLTLKFIERDKITRDELVRVKDVTLDPKNFQDRITESFKKEELNTEWGDEEYEVKLKLKPLKLPSSDSIITGRTVIDV